MANEISGMKSTGHFVKTENDAGDNNIKSEFF